VKWIDALVEKDREIKRLRAENERLEKRTKFSLSTELERLRAELEETTKKGARENHEEWGEKWRSTAQEVERLRNLYDQADLARAQLELRVTRLRKAVNWLRGAFHDEVCNFADPERPLPLDKCDTWECQRARAVLEEETE
jgi:hypothetical protein